MIEEFKYLQPESLPMATGWLQDGGGTALPYSGGTDLLDLMKSRIATPSYLVNLKKLPGMDAIEVVPGKGLRIGALVRIADIAEHPLIRQTYTALAEAAEETASPQLRNMGTIGGNLCQRPRCWYFRGDFHCLRKGGSDCYAVDGENTYHCIIGGGPCFIVHPSDPAVALLALDAKVHVASSEGTRTLPIGEFFVLPEEDVHRENVLKPGEIVTAVEVPEPPSSTVSGYVKFKDRGAWDFAVVSVAAVLQRNGSTITGGQVALGGVAPVPWLESSVSRKLAGATASDTDLDQLVMDALHDAVPLEQNEYKLPLARNLIKRKIQELMA